MAINFLNMLAQAIGAAPEMVDPETIQVEGGRRRIGPVGAPQVVQPAYVEPPEDMRDPSIVDPNNPALLDRRAMIFAAQEAQRKAAAQAAGVDYEERQQKGDYGEFKARPGLQLGTTGLLRDVIGNAWDWAGALIGRDPTYRKERLMDELYGWDQPGQRDAAIARGMQYDPAMTQEFLKNVTAVEGQRATTAANQEYKSAMTQERLSKRVGGMATSILSSGNPERVYQAMRPALQQQLADVGADIELPAEYDPAIVNGLSRFGYGPGETQREATAALRDTTMRELTDKKIASAQQIAALNAASRERVARMYASNRYSIAEIQAEVRRELAANRPVLTGEEMDPATGSTTRTYGRAGDVTNPAPRRFRRIQ